MIMSLAGSLCACVAFAQLICDNYSHKTMSRSLPIFPWSYGVILGFYCLILRVGLLGEAYLDLVPAPPRSAA
jgi:hypothetical protein